MWKWKCASGSCWVYQTQHSSGKTVCTFLLQVAWAWRDAGQARCWGKLYNRQRINKASSSMCVMSSMHGSIAHSLSAAWQLLCLRPYHVFSPSVSRTVCANPRPSRELCSCRALSSTFSVLASRMISFLYEQLPNTACRPSTPGHVQVGMHAWLACNAMHGMQSEHREHEQLLQLPVCLNSEHVSQLIDGKVHVAQTSVTCDITTPSFRFTQGAIPGLFTCQSLGWIKYQQQAQNEQAHEHCIFIDLLSLQLSIHMPCSCHRQNTAPLASVLRHLKSTISASCTRLVDAVHLSAFSCMYCHTCCVSG